MIDAACVQCGRHDERLTGYCQACGGIRLAVGTGLGIGDLSPSQTPSPVRVSRVPGLEGLRLKFEGTMPTGSFKDRVMTVLVREAVEAGARGAVVASSGNAGVAAAAACAAAGLPLLVLVPAKTRPERVLAAEVRGAAIVRGGEDPSVLYALAAQLAGHHQLADLASTFASPGCEWACRQIGHEVAEQVDGPIETIMCSISVGPVLVGTGRGLAETGRIHPLLVGVQAEGCSPIAQAFKQGHERVEAWTAPIATRAVAIADRLHGYPDEGTYALGEIRRSGGFVSAVGDEEMEQMRQDFARWDGLDVELSSCAAPAAWRESQRSVNGAVCVLTGHGIRDTLRGAAQAPYSVAEFAHKVGAGDALLRELAKWMRVAEREP